MKRILNRFRKPNEEEPGFRVADLLDRVLEVIVDGVQDDDPDRQAQFNCRMDELRREVRMVPGTSIDARIAEDVLELCRDEFKVAVSSRFEREAHLTEIILFLRRALAGLSGDAQTFHGSLLEKSDRIKKLIQINNIHELKTRVAAEVSELHKIIVEKKEREQVQLCELSEQVTALQKKLKVAKTEASIDGLTGIANRRVFDFTLERWLTEHRRDNGAFTIALLDLDDFKEINDNHGHQIGDRVLVSAATELSRSIRPSDFLARYGGDEFVILSSGMSLHEAEHRLAGLLKKLQATPFECNSLERGVLSVSLTATCGVAEYAAGESSKDLIQRADEALYEAKHQGKNRVVARGCFIDAIREGRTPA